MNNFLKSNLQKILNDVVKFDYPTDKYLSFFLKKIKNLEKKIGFIFQK